jgi:putative NADH-flavin reductase
MFTRRFALALALAGVAFGSGAMAQEKAAKPLNITVYGGSGNIGSRIVAEAAARGHHVTVVDRNPKPDSAPAGVRTVKGDVFDPADIGKNIAGQDVLVVAVAARPTPTRDFYVRLVKSAVEAQRAQQGNKTRYLMVGGASSLETGAGDGKRVVDTLPATLPDAVKNEVLSMVEALDYLRTVKDTSWTFFSPAGSITAGVRTGKFRVGSDTLIKDDKGNSRISFEDYAVAMLNEIEKPQYVNKRFTVGY